jgi:NitT/TauT family transport system ATP-binding protein
MNAIEIKNLNLSFGKLQILSGVSLSIQEGEIVGFIGPSGCGKSTLLRIIAGIIPSQIPATLEGEISVFGSKPVNLKGGLIDMIFQEGNLLPWRNSFSNLKLGLEILRNGKHGMSPNEMLDKIGLANFAKIKPAKLSGGMRQRVSLGASLITSPKILLMDEPFAALDALTKERMWMFVEELKSKGLISTAIIVTHQIEEAVVLSDKVYIFTGRPSSIIDMVEVSLPKPRMGKSGYLDPDFFDIANEVRSIIRRQENEN